jgi:hypothetical protein
MDWSLFEKSVMDLAGKKPAEWRKGQAVFNAVDTLYGVARTVQFVDGVDCFYDDSVIPDFLYRAWVRYNELMRKQ